ncbi:hypothetical protein PoHVEF18_009927 [Penicillium ochrochloron]
MPDSDPWILAGQCVHYCAGPVAYDTPEDDEEDPAVAPKAEGNDEHLEGRV